MHCNRAILTLLEVPPMSLKSPFESFNHKRLDEFKQSINYSALIAAPPTEKNVDLDWQAELKTIIDYEGVTWKSDVKESVLNVKEPMALRLTLTSEQVIVNIKYIAGDWPTRLSFFVSERAFVNRADINYKLVPSFEDIYLIPKFGTDVTFVHFLYGHFDIKIMHAELYDVQSVADAIYQLVKNSSESGIPIR